ncbi:MAG: Rha family transcriptional regulator [Candidatus Saccharibacteria bacterium]|nr:Rha family transcriptional regulator [Rhodoferax sp.]
MSPALNTKGAAEQSTSSHPLTLKENSMHPTETSVLSLVATKDEQRVDSRLLAANMGKVHQSLFELVKDHRADFEDFGKVRFETGPSPGSKTGQKERFAMLNEDQAFLLLTYTRNTARTRQLKVRLVKAFGEARRAAQAHSTEYLPGYHALHDAMYTLAAGSPNERFAYSNLNKLVNKAVGIEAGQRSTLADFPRSAVIMAHAIATRAILGANDAKEAYILVKQALSTMVLLTRGGMLR